MALTATEEALVRQLLDQQAAILSLAGNESTTTSKLGATKVTLSDLVSASAVADADLFLLRQGTTDKSVTGAIVKALATQPDASETVKGIVELATVAEALAGTDTTRAVTPAGLVSRTPAIKAQSPLGIGATATLDASHVGRPLYYSGASAGTLTLPAAPTAGDAITVYAVGAGNCTIQRNGAQTIYAQGKSSGTSVVLNTGASLTLVYDGSAWVQAVGNNSIGYSAAYSNTTITSGVTYYNTTGKPALLVLNATGGQLISSLNIGGVAVGGYVAGSSNVMITAIVPPGASYVVNHTGLQSAMLLS